MTLTDKQLAAIRERYESVSAYLDRWDGADYKLEPDDVHAVDDIPILLDEINQLKAELEPVVVKAKAWRATWQMQASDLPASAVEVRDLIAAVDALPSSSEERS
jgi:hypothetical protein